MATDDYKVSDETRELVALLHRHYCPDKKCAGDAHQVRDLMAAADIRLHGWFKVPEQSSQGREFCLSWLDDDGYLDSIYVNLEDEAARPFIEVLRAGPGNSP